MGAPHAEPVSILRSHLNTIRSPIQKKKKKTSFLIGQQTKKILNSVTCALFSFFNFCSLKKLKASSLPQISIDEFPAEVLFRIVESCDFGTQLNLRATSRRMFALVEYAGKARRQVVGGLELGRIVPSLADLSQSSSAVTLAITSSSTTGLCLIEREWRQTDHFLSQRHLLPRTASFSGQLLGHQSEGRLRPMPSLAGAEEWSAGQQHVSLRRIISQGQALLVLPLDRLHAVMRRLCVCHALHVRGLAIDEDMAARLLAADFRAIRDLILDRITTTSPHSLHQLLEKVCPARSLYVFNHTDLQAAEALRPSLFIASPAIEVAIEAAEIGLVHPAFDDDSLCHIVLNESVIRRCIRLPLCVITHEGLIRAIKAFHTRCIWLASEYPDSSPLWELIITLPASPLIAREQVVVPEEMRDQCKLWTTPTLNYSLEVRVERMNLRIHVDYGRRGQLGLSSTFW